MAGCMSDRAAGTATTSSELPFQTTVTQYNNYDKYDTLYIGEVNTTTPEIVLTPGVGTEGDPAVACGSKSAIDASEPTRIVWEFFSDLDWFSSEWNVDRSLAWHCRGPHRRLRHRAGYRGRSLALCNHPCCVDNVETEETSGEASAVKSW